MIGAYYRLRESDVLVFSLFIRICARESRDTPEVQCGVNLWQFKTADLNWVCPCI